MEGIFLEAEGDRLRFVSLGGPMPVHLRKAIDEFRAGLFQACGGEGTERRSQDDPLGLAERRRPPQVSCHACGGRWYVKKDDTGRWTCLGCHPDEDSLFAERIEVGG